MAHDGEAAAEGLIRKLSTILSADVAGFSRLMAEDEEATLTTFRGHRQVFESLVAHHRGRVFNTAGDAILAEFASAVEAVRCATEIQAAIATRNDALPEARRVAFRIGVNLGDVMVQGADLLGDGVNVAARLQAAAEPGGICLSGSVYDQIRNKLSLGFQSLGEMSFKNIPQPVRTFSITSGESGAALPTPRPTPPPRRGARVVVVGLAVLVLAGAGLGWTVYRERAAETARTEQARAEAAAAEAQSQAAAKRDAEVAEARAAAEAARRDAALAVERARSAAALERAEAERRRLEAEKQAADAARKQAESERQRLETEKRQAEDAQRKAAAQAAATAAPPAPASTAADGTYAGSFCLGEATTEAARCFRAAATVAGGRMTGQWPGTDPTHTVMLSGDIAGTGEVKIAMHTENPDGSWRANSSIIMIGTLREGRVEASGKYPTGRTASLDWRREVPGAPKVASAGSAEGTYAGPICLGETPKDPARCYRARGVLAQGKLTGEWPAQDRTLTVRLSGEVSPTGEASIVLHAEDADGTVRRNSSARLTGRLQDGRIEANGVYETGRTATLTWTRN